MTELSTLMETHSNHNSKLREENTELAKKMTTLLGHYEDREKNVGGRTEEYALRLKLYEAQLAKAKIEKAGELMSGN
jgi:hypothetical protein